MCGRFVLKAPGDEVKEYFDCFEDPSFPERYNIAPTQPIGVVRQEGDRRRFSLVRWGLVPGWVKDLKDFTLLINARSETALEKPSFKNSMKHHRCLIPVSGFYEWKREGGPKTPYYIFPREHNLIAFAGLWARWMNAEGSELDSAAILTRAANGPISRIHHRMPCVIHREDFDRWLDVRNVLAKEAATLLRPVPENFFDLMPVGARVNNVVNDGSALIEKAEPAEEQTQSARSGVRSRKTGKVHDGRQGQLDLF